MTTTPEAKIREILDEWDRSGAIKTSLYYRLQSAMLDPKAVARNERKEKSADQKKEK